MLGQLERLDFVKPDKFEPTFRYAMSAEPDLQPLTKVCELYRVLDSTGQIPESFDVWLGLIKPWASRLVGWERGAIFSADDVDPSKILAEISGDKLIDWLEKVDRYTEPETYTELWLRSSQAFDVVTDELRMRAGI